MLYTEFINKAMYLTIEQADNGLFYLEPMWRSILNDNQLTLKDVSDVKAGWNDIYDILRLEVEKRNTINSKKPAVIDWLYDLITAQIEPAMLAEETDYLKNLTEYMKANHESQRLAEEQEQWDKFKNT